jgi:protein transport protein SEC24
MNILLRQAVSSMRLGEQTVQQVKEGLISRSVNILTAYRRHCAQPNSSLGQLILPEALKLLPVYVTGALKCDAIDGGPEMTPDDKAFAQIRTLGASARNSQVILYPRLLRLTYEKDSADSLRTEHVRCSEKRLDDPDAVAYILENSFYLFLYIVNDIRNPTPPPRQVQFIKNVFGVETIQAIVTDTVSLISFVSPF